MTMKLPVAKYAGAEIALMMIITVITGYVFLKTFPFLIILPLLILGFTFYFFRDPERKIPEDSESIVSAADGKIIEIMDVNEESFLKEPAVKITVFLSVFNVHINRAPYAGRVVMIDYRKGKFLVAHRPEASDQNERNSVGFIGASGVKVLVKQIAGIIAPRIVCDVAVNQDIQKGQRIGMIKFGSRTEIFIPKNRIEKISVLMGDKVKGGETILGLLKNESKTKEN